MCIVRRMPRMQVYLPDELYAEVKAQALPASELLQAAIRSELRRRAILEATDEYLQDLVAEVGEPTQRDLEVAEALLNRLQAAERHRQAN